MQQDQASLPELAEGLPQNSGIKKENQDEHQKNFNRRYDACHLAALLWTVTSLERLWSDRGVTALLGTGLVLFLGGVFSDVLINFADSHHHRSLQIFVEELLEMAGATTILWGALRLLKLRGVPG